MAAHQGKFRRKDCDKGINKIKRITHGKVEKGGIIIICIGIKDCNHYYYIQGLPCLTEKHKSVKCHLLSIEDRFLRLVQVYENDESEELGMTENIFDVGGYLNQYLD